MRHNHKITFAYLLWLYLGWTVYVAYIYQNLITYGAYGEIINELARFVIYVMPLFWILPKIEFPKFTDLGFHGDFIKNISIGIVVSIIFIAIAAPLTMLSKGMDIGVESISVASIWVGLSFAVVVEEIVFRGYLLNSFLCYGKAKAVLVSSILFLLIHFPGWWLLGTHSSLVGWITTSASIFILGVILSILFLRFNSLWICILVHSANNLVAASVM